jgi:D-beta-D-heptose 7-phosphate kinase/D-beta-D-heptose 1-phosphate adenosyltransferase
VVHVGEHQQIAGGAANVAVNVAQLGAKATVIGLIGDDEAGAMLISLLQKAQVDPLLIPTAQPTIVKLRVLAQHQQLIRLDFEQTYSDQYAEQLAELFEEQVKHTDVVILSDYDKGVLAQAPMLIEIARRYDVPVFVDPKRVDLSHYAGASVITPNLKEFKMVVGAVPNEEALVSKAQALLNDINIASILITRGDAGMTLVHRGHEGVHFKAQAREVYDVTGAGDTVLALLATSYAAGLDLAQAADLANIGAGIVVGKMGTAYVTPAELQAALPDAGDSKVLCEEMLLLQVKKAKERGQRIVMTNGCFDILHAGHVQYLAQAKALGDKFIVAVNDDNSVARLKGADRPLNHLSDRMKVLAALQAVDWVVPFSEDTPKRLIEAVLPTVLVKGGDYEVHQIAGHEAVLAAGGDVTILPFKEGNSTTRLIEKILQVKEPA